MKTQFWLLLSLLTASAIFSKLIDVNDEYTLSPYKILEKFILIPKEDKLQNNGVFGELRIKLHHNIRNATLWIVGFDGSVDEIEEVLSEPNCYKLIDKAAFSEHTQHHTSPSGSGTFLYEDRFRIRNEKYYESREGNIYTNYSLSEYYFTYWVILNCFHPIYSCSNLDGNICQNAPEYTVGPLHYAMNARWTNGEGGIGKELSFDEIGFPEVGTTIQMFLDSIHLYPCPYNCA